MPKHEFKETIVIGDKVYFKGEAEVSEKELGSLKAAETERPKRILGEGSEPEEAPKRRGK